METLKILTNESEVGCANSIPVSMTKMFLLEFVNTNLVSTLKYLI